MPGYAPRTTPPAPSRRRERRTPDRSSAPSPRRRRPAPRRCRRRASDRPARRRPRAQTPKDRPARTVRRWPCPSVARSSAGPSRVARNRSTTSTSARVAATGSGAAATAEITATPAAPVSSTLRGVRGRPRRCPPPAASWPDHRREPFEPAALGLRLRRRRPHRHAQVVRTRAFRRRGLLRVADAHARAPARDPAAAGRRRDRPPAPHARPAAPLSIATSSRSFTTNSTPASRHVRESSEATDEQRVVVRARVRAAGPRWRPPRSPLRATRPMVPIGAERRRRDDVDPERSRIDHLDSLRRY